MRGFVVGILTAVVSGILLWFATDMAASWKASRAQVVEYRSARVGQRVLATKELVASLSEIQPGDVLSMLTIENKGREDLDNASFLIQTEYKQKDRPILAMGVLQNIPSDGLAPTITITDKGARIEYKLLRPNEGASLWVRSGDIGDLKVRSDRKGLILEDKTTDTQSDFSDTVPLWALFVVAFAALVAGILIGEMANRAALRKIGFDPNDFDQAYIDASKKTKS